MLEVVENDGETAQQTLAKANLCRVRQEFAEGIELCLTVLKHHPENVEAHVLLGDLYLARGQKTQAAQWYELALELDPQSAPALDRARALSSEIQSENVTRSEKSLGLEDRSGTRATYAALVVGLIVILGLTAIVISRSHGGASDPSSTTIHDPVMAQDTVPGKITTPVKAPESVPVVPAEDEAVRQTLAKGTFGDHVLSGRFDPRSKVMTATYQVDGPLSRQVVAQIGKSALESAPESASITLRLMSEGKLIYMADIRRVRLDETTTQEWQDQHPGPQAWADYVVENEWQR